MKSLLGWEPRAPGRKIGGFSSTLKMPRGQVLWEQKAPVTWSPFLPTPVCTVQASHHTVRVRPGLLGSGSSMAGSSLDSHSHFIDWETEALQGQKAGLWLTKLGFYFGVLGLLGCSWLPRGAFPTSTACSDTQPSPYPIEPWEIELKTERELCPIWGQWISGVSQGQQLGLLPMVTGGHSMAVTMGCGCYVLGLYFKNS